MCSRPKRELIRTVLSRASIGDRTLILDVYETACAGFAQAVKSDSRSEPPVWLPASVRPAICSLSGGFSDSLELKKENPTEKLCVPSAVGCSGLLARYFALYESVLACPPGVGTAFRPGGLRKLHRFHFSLSLTSNAKTTA